MTPSAAPPVRRSPGRRGRAGGRVRLPALAALLAWGVAGWLAAAWGWRLWGQAQGAGLVAPPPSSAPVVQVETMVRALGGGDGRTDTPAPAAVAATGSAWRLLGVLADGGGQGAALLAADGRPARPYRVGATLPDGWRVQRIERDGVWLAPPQGGEAVRLPAPVRPAVSATARGTGG
ncbi:type II secretion system protein N [Tepidimonas sp.]|uniref:type II secretion system protein N n=1 Tax=Tepidimonas sp. TaxID=2002775 RepID=UPI00391A3437